jgi:thiol-disulfide isomerase/thioredoxin
MIYEFYGETCPHCLEMKTVVEAVEKETGVTFEKLEVWNNEANAAKLEEIDGGRCGGVPFYYNDQSKKYICGACGQDELMALVKG